MIFSKKAKPTTKKQNRRSSGNQHKTRQYVDGSAVRGEPVISKPMEKKTMTKKTTPKFTTSSKSATPSFNASRFSAATPASETRKLTVGKDISLSGEIGACDHLVVEGTVEATIKDGQSLEITETGLFKGTVEIDDATIAGRFEGNLVVKGHLIVRSTGSVSGDIRYGDLVVETGATLNGSIQCAGLPVVEKSENDKKVGTMRPVFKTTVANEDDMLHEEVPVAAPVTATML